MFESDDPVDTIELLDKSLDRERSELYSFEIGEVEIGRTKDGTALGRSARLGDALK